MLFTVSASTSPSANLYLKKKQYTNLNFIVLVYGI